MMYFATASALVLTIVGSAYAIPQGSYAPGSSQCSTGNIKCCNSVQSADSPDVGPIIDALKLVIPTDTQVGMACDPINPTTVGGGQSCNAMPVCCEGNSFGGFSIGCTPIPVIL